MLMIGPIGSEGRTITCAHTVMGHEIIAGCWRGTVEELRARVSGDDHGWRQDDVDRYRAEYLAACDLMALRVVEWRVAEWEKTS